MATPQETLLGTPETLPTTEPATPQAGYTLASSDMPAFSFFYTSKYVAIVYAAGKFVTAGTLSWRMKKNGASVSTGTTAVAANNYYTVSAYFYDVVQGDVLEIALWSNKTDSNYDYKALQVFPTRTLPFRKLSVLNPVTFHDTYSKPVLTLGNPAPRLSGNMNPLHLQFPLDSIAAGYSAVKYDTVKVKTGYGLFKVSRGDAAGPNSPEVAVSATVRPWYTQNVVPSKLTMRALNFDEQTPP